MSAAAPAGRSKNIAVTVLSLLTLLWGGGNAALGGGLLVGGAGWLAHPGDEPWGPVITLGGIIPALVIAIGVAFLLLGILGLLAGLGLLLRQPWGRILTFIVAVLAVLSGLASLGAYEPGDSSFDIALGAPQVLYGILAFVILIMNGAAFSRPRV
jgi:hypothetical protein